MTIETIEHLFAPNLPLRIKQARARAVEHPELFLKGKVTALVQVLITYTNLDRIETPIRFNRERPATILGVSTRTIDRLLKSLESLGWLKRLPQPRLDAGSWGCTSISWSKWVLDEVFTAEAVSDKWGKKVSRARRSVRASDSQGEKGAFDAPSLDANSCANRATQSAHLSSSPKGEVFQNKVVTDASFEEDQKPKPQHGRRIPVDLVDPMTEFGLTPSNICWLMARCKTKGMRLQHVLSATMEQMRTRSLRAGQAVAWLMYMINLKRDYAYEARQAQDQRLQVERKSRRSAFLQAVADKVFTRDRLLPGNLVVVDHSHGVVTMAKAGTTDYRACPAAQFARGLLAQDPWWVRRVMRGRDDRIAPAPERSQTTRQAQSTSGMQPDRTTCRGHLANIKQLLSRRRAMDGKTSHELK